MEINSNASPRMKVLFSDVVNNSIVVNLTGAMIDKKETMEAEEVNSAAAFVKMKITNAGLVLSPGTVSAAANATVATSAATTMPELAVPFDAALTSFKNFLCLALKISFGVLPSLFLIVSNSGGTFSIHIYV